VRQRVRDGQALPQEIQLSDIEDDQFLKPVLEDDALIFSIDDLPEPEPVGSSSTSQPDDLARRNAELEAQFGALAKQFDSYRLAVQETLDRRWTEDDVGAPAVADLPREPPSGAPKSRGGQDDSQYYWESYAYTGWSCLPTALPDAVRLHNPTRYS
jgi:protein arginine N-methyltransferase 3